MRISDWSSDVCSSDLAVTQIEQQLGAVVQLLESVPNLKQVLHHPQIGQEAKLDLFKNSFKDELSGVVYTTIQLLLDRGRATILDRKSVVSGKSGSVRVDCGGRRIINTKKKKQK